MQDLPLNNNVPQYRSNQRHNSDDMLHLFSKLMEQMKNDLFILCFLPLYILPRFSEKEIKMNISCNHTSFKYNIYHLKWLKIN